MTLSIRWKLLGSYLLLLLMMGGVLFAYLSRTLEQQLIEDLHANLQREARLAALMVGRESDRLAQDAPRLTREVSSGLRARVTLLTIDGKVVGDSDLSEVSLAELDDYRSRPEIAAVLRGETGRAVRNSLVLDQRMLYVAVPFPAEAREPGILRLALPLSAVDQARASLQQSLALSFVLASLLAIGLSLILTQVSSRILHVLTEGARRFGAGDFRRRVPVVSNDELGELARVLNTMADRLQIQMEGLGTERSRLDTILRGMGEGLLVTDGNGVITLVNPAFKALFELTDEPTGRPLAEICQHPVLLETFHHLQRLGSEQVAEIVLPHPAETTLLTHWVPLREEGEVTGVVAVFHDISTLKRLERVRRDFVANVSHELRTPVTVIRGYAETLATESVDPAVTARFAAIIQTHATRLASLISDLLTLSELEANNSSLDLQPVKIADLVDHCRTLLLPKAEEKGISTKNEVTTDVTVLADRRRLEQVLVNLLDNAVKYTPAQGCVAVRAIEEDALVRVEVSDTGPGIPLHDQPRIFERFYRVDAGRSRDQGGTGLGLAIVKHIVQLHGGTVDVESTPGQGACFRFTLRRG